MHIYTAIAMIIYMIFTASENHLQLQQDDPCAIFAQAIACSARNSFCASVARAVRACMLRTLLIDHGQLACLKLFHLVTTTPCAWATHDSSVPIRTSPASSLTPSQCTCTSAYTYS